MGPAGYLSGSNQVKKTEKAGEKERSPRGKDKYTGEEFRFNPHRQEKMRKEEGPTASWGVRAGRSLRKRSRKITALRSTGT